VKKVVLVRKKRTILALVALTIAVAVVGGAIEWSIHIHPDESPRDDPDCIICQFGNLLANILVAVGFVLLVLLLRLKQALTLACDRDTGKRLTIHRLARAPPASF